MTRRALFRLDAGRDIGLGHAVRCLALAHELKFRGWTCQFAVNVGARALITNIADTCVDIIEGDVFDDPGALGRAVGGDCDLLIVDSYSLDAEFERGCRSWAPRVLVIDDLADRPHKADVLVDATLGRGSDAYTDLAPHARVLTGASYALIAEPFARARLAALRRRLASASGDESARSLLVSLGGAPPAAWLERLTRVARDAAPHSRIDVAAGGSEFVDPTDDPDVHVHHGKVDMAALTARADLALAAGGGSSWERCCLGLPTVLVEVAGNQHDVALGLESAGAVVRAGLLDDISDDALTELVRAALEDGPGLGDMRRRAALVCDGLGVRRVANAVEALFEDAALPVALRPATIEDSADMLRWQSEPGARQFANTPRVPTHDEHIAWVDRRLADPLAGPFEIIEVDGAPAGVVRFDREPDDDGAFRVSILVASEAQGRGVARRALLAAGRLAPGAVLIADVLAGNQASHALFQACGYDRVAQEQYRRALICVAPDTD